MSSDAMKLELIQWLSQLEDMGVLKFLLQFKKSNVVANRSDELSEDQHAAIAEGEADLNAGRVTSSEELWKKYGRREGLNGPRELSVT